MSKAIQIHFFSLHCIGLNIQPIIVDENVFERDAVQLNISWKSADLGGKPSTNDIMPNKYYLSDIIMFVFDVYTVHTVNTAISSSLEYEILDTFYVISGAQEQEHSKFFFFHLVWYNIVILLVVANQNVTISYRICHFQAAGGCYSVNIIIMNFSSVNYIKFSVSLSFEQYKVLTKNFI